MKNTKINNINNEERRRSGATGTGITQKNLQLGNTNNGKKALEKLAEKGRAHFKLDLGTVRLHIISVVIYVHDFYSQVNLRMFHLCPL